MVGNALHVSAAAAAVVVFFFLPDPLPPKYLLT